MQLSQLTFRNINYKYESLYILGISIAEFIRLHTA